MRIAITGSVAYDYIMTYPGEFREMLMEESLDKISVSFLVDEMTRHRGGVGANIAYTLALLGEHPVLVATAGQDFAEYRGILDKVGVDTSGIRVHEDVFTASFFVSTDRRNNQIASFYTGAMARARSLPLRDAVDGAFDTVLVSPNDPIAMRNYLAEARASHIPCIYDPSQQIARMTGDELAEDVDGVFILIMNEYEHAALCNKTGFNQEALLAKAQNVIITQGEKGTDIYTRSEMFHIPIVPPDHIVDPTGVGDAFRAGLLKGLAAGLGWDISGRMGALAATYVLEQRGPQNHQFTLREFIQRYRAHFDDAGQLDSLLAD